MESSRRRSLRLRSESLEMFEDRLLLSTLPAHHPHHLHATVHQLSKRAPIGPWDNPQPATRVMVTHSF